MSYVRKKHLKEKISTIRSVKSFVQEFMLDTKAGQKIFLYNPKLPRIINISLNEATCPFKCLMCPYVEQEVREMYAEGHEMEFSTFKNIVKCIPNDPYYSLDFSSIGETLEFKKIAEFIKYAKTQKPLVNTTISTNGLLLNHDMGEKIILSGLDNIQISLMSGNTEYHNLITGTKTFGKVRQNIIDFWNLKKYLKAQKPFVQIFMLEAIETQPFIKEFLDEYSQYSDKAFVRPLYNVGRQIQGLTTLDDYAIPSRRYPCITPWYSTAIRSNGDVLACYIFHWHKQESKTMVVGNINHQTLEEIWQSDLMQKLRKWHLSGAYKGISVCEKCNSWAAYTNIWEWVPSAGGGGYVYNTPSLLEFFQKSGRGRGG